MLYLSNQGQNHICFIANQVCDMLKQNKPSNQNDSTLPEYAMWYINL